MGCLRDLGEEESFKCLAVVLLYLCVHVKAVRAQCWPVKKVCYAF
jgi:hypothetical protein